MYCGNYYGVGMGALKIFFLYNAVMFVQSKVKFSRPPFSLQEMTHHHDKRETFNFSAK